MSEKFIKIAVAIGLIWAWASWTGGCSDGVLAMSIAVGASGGKHVSGEPLTLVSSKEGSPDLLRNEIDERIVKIRPMATPVDQISRLAGSRKSGAMVVEYYSVDTKATVALVKSCADAGQTVENYAISKITTADTMIFEPTETVLVHGVKGTTMEGEEEDLILYVSSKGEGNTMNVVAVNNVNAQGRYVVPALPADTLLIRMGRAAGELDVQTAQFEPLPTKKSNYCQIFKAQVEQSTYHKIANKEAGWTFSDQEEAAIIDMRQGMEKNFLFGSKCRVFDPVKREQIMLTGGIWQQAGKQATYTQGEMTMNRLIEIARTAFTGNSGSSKKVLVGGTRLIETLNKMEVTKVVGAGETMTRWGLDFTEIVTKFGRLYVLASEVFDECGHEHDGMVIDPEYITKYCHVPFRTEKLNLRASGVRNTDAIVITEASCLVLRYPKAHMRIIGTKG